MENKLSLLLQRVEGKQVAVNTSKTEKQGQYVAKITLPDCSDLATLLKVHGFERRNDYKD